MKPSPVTAAHRVRLEAALESADSADSLRILAMGFRDDGVAQAPLYRLFDEYRLQAEEAGDDDVCDWLDEVLDAIAGWAEPERRLFPTELEL